MTKTVFEDTKQLLDYYSIQAQDFRMRHTAIWIEIQHYTWVLSILLGAGPIAAVNQTSLNSMQLSFLLILPIIGVLIALVAFFIIRRDFLYYSQADARLLYIEKKLGVLLENDYLDERLKRAKDSNFSVNKDIDKRKKIDIRLLFKSRIRALILFSFFIYVIAGLCEIGYFAYLIASNQ